MACMWCVVCDVGPVLSVLSWVEILERNVTTARGLGVGNAFVRSCAARGFGVGNAPGRGTRVCELRFQIRSGRVTGTCPGADDVLRWLRMCAGFGGCLSV